MSTYDYCFFLSMWATVGFTLLGLVEGIRSRRRRIILAASRLHFGVLAPWLIDRYSEGLRAGFLLLLIDLTAISILLATGRRQFFELCNFIALLTFAVHLAVFLVMP